MLKRTEIEDCVEHASVAFDECWEFVAKMKLGELLETATMSILHFQPRLATALLGLSDMYSRVSAEQKNWIGRKSRVSLPWFKRRMRYLDSQAEVLRQATLIGKSIGDAFAWYFYQRNRYFLQEHLRQPEQQLVSSGIGGRAEVEMARQLPMFDGKFVLHHVITSILRLGDISLVRLDQLAITTIGELKAGIPKDGQLSVKVLFALSEKEAAAVAAARPNEELELRDRHQEQPVTLSQAANDRLRRQIRRMSESQDHLEFKPDRVLSQESTNRIGELESFIDGIEQRKTSFRIVGDSLLLVGLKLPKSTLYARLSNRKDSRLRKRLTGVESHAMRLLLPGRSDNSIRVAGWFYRGEGQLHHRPGMTHPVWWPMKAASLRRVVFREVVVTTALNPAHLFLALETAGYDVDVRRDAVSATKRIRDKESSLDGIESHLDLIQHYMFSEADIVAFLSQIEKHISEISHEGSGRIDLHIEQHFGKATRA